MCRFFIGHTFHIHKDDHETIIRHKGFYALIYGGPQLGRLCALFGTCGSVLDPDRGFDLIAIAGELLQGQGQVAFAAAQLIVTGIDRDTRQPTLEVSAPE